VQNCSYRCLSPRNSRHFPVPIRSKDYPPGDLAESLPFIYRCLENSRRPKQRRAPAASRGSQAFCFFLTQALIHSYLVHIVCTPGDALTSLSSPFSSLAHPPLNEAHPSPLNPQDHCPRRVLFGNKSLINPSTKRTLLRLSRITRTRLFSSLLDQQVCMRHSSHNPSTPPSSTARVHFARTSGPSGLRIRPVVRLFCIRVGWTGDSDSQKFPTPEATEGLVYYMRLFPTCSSCYLS
jgi:hypothetical protein